MRCHAPILGRGRRPRRPVQPHRACNRFTGRRGRRPLPGDMTFVWARGVTLSHHNRTAEIGKLTAEGNGVVTAAGEKSGNRFPVGMAAKVSEKIHRP